MKTFLERLLVRLWNRSRVRTTKQVRTLSLDLGLRILDDGSWRGRIVLANEKRTEHVAVLGKTGTGKSSLLRYMAKQDIASSRGFVFFDLHGDATPFLLAAVAAQERATKQDLSGRLIVIEPSDPECSVGLNPLEGHASGEEFLQSAEFTQVLRRHWGLDYLGARTDELLRNSLYVLAQNRLTLLEMSLLLSDAVFRGACIKNVRNAEVRQYFELRYDQVSEPMRATMKEPILNKLSAFTADPRFRHIVGQRQSTFSVLEAMDRGCWIVLNLHKGKLGEQAATLGSLFLTKTKHSVFGRRSRDLFTLYCDEIQNLVAYGSDLETMLSESRKFGIGIVSANQFLDQYPPEMRSALTAIGSHIFFQLSAPDGHQIATALDGGKALVEILKNLPHRHMIVKLGHERWQQAVVPTIQSPNVDTDDLYERCRARWAKKRTEIEQEIAARRATLAHTNDEALDAWE
jgi:energy-coupling factor transporter ATP-binding protein EcfA2